MHHVLMTVIRSRPPTCPDIESSQKALSTRAPAEAYSVPIAELRAKGIWPNSFHHHPALKTLPVSSEQLMDSDLDSAQSFSACPSVQCGMFEKVL